MKKLILLIVFIIVTMTCNIFANTTNENLVKYDENVFISTLKVDAPANIRIYNDNSFRFLLRSNNENINRRIRYSIKDSVLNVWIDKSTPEEITNLSPENLVIAITAPNDIDIKTNNSLLITSKPDKKKNLTNYENN